MTESGVRHSLEKLAPGKKFHFVPNEQCNCSECPYMKRNTLEKLRDALRDLKPRVELSAGSDGARARCPSSGCWRCTDDSAHRHFRPRARQSAHQRDGPLQHPLLLLHAGRGREVSAARADSELRGDRAVRARGGDAGRAQAAHHRRRAAGAQESGDADPEAGRRSKASRIWR